MGEFLTELLHAPIGNVFLIAGLAFLALGIVGKVSGKVEPGPRGRVASVVAGVVFILVGVEMHVREHRDVPAAEAPTSPGAEPPESRGAEPPEPPGGPPPGTARVARAAVIGTSQQSAAAATALLEGFAREVRAVSAGQLQELGVFAPELVVVTSDTGRAWSGISPTILQSVFGRQKVVGLGTGGADLFQAMGANIGSGAVMHSPGNYAVSLGHFPTEFAQKPAIPDSFIVHVGVQADAIGVYDEGSPTLGGFEAIARWQQNQHHWPIVRQGNLLLWGFDAPLTTLTDDGRLLFLALLQDHVRRPFVSFQDIRPSVAYVSPGPIDDRLTPQFTGNVFHFRVNRPGPIRARLTWNRPGENLALILNGPGQVGYYARKDGASPLQIDFPVTSELVSRGNEWRISVKDFGQFDGPIDYHLNLDFPQ